MFTSGRWVALPIAVLATVAPINPAFSQPVTLSPAAPTIQLRGTSGGNQKDNSCARFIAATPNHTVQVAEDMDLRFVLQGAGQPALLIKSPAGKNFCVPADPFSQGRIEIPGRWRKGTYAVYVGDRANESHAYTLVISSQ